MLERESLDQVITSIFTAAVFSSLGLLVSLVSHRGLLAAAESSGILQLSKFRSNLRRHLHDGECGYVAQEGGQHPVAWLNRERPLPGTGYCAFFA